MWKSLLAALIGLWTVVPAYSAGQQKQKEEEPPTQTLEAPKEPPAAVSADSERLVFYLSPPSSKGLLSQQLRDGLKALLTQAGSSPIVKLRAFVAGSGDTRRVQAIVSETYTARRQALPALTVVQAGALVLPGVQVVMEATAVSRKAVNRNGLAFVAARSAEAAGLTSRVAPLARQAAQRLREALSSAGLEGRDVLLATCFVTSVEDVGDVRSVFTGEFPKAVLNLVQLERAPARAAAGCQLVAALRSPAGSSRSLKTTGVSMVGPGRLVLSGGQMAFGYSEEDARLAFQRLGRTLEQAGSSIAQAVSVGYYALSHPAGEQAVKVGEGFLNSSRAPSVTVMQCVGLPAIDASFAVDAVAVTNNTR